MIDHLIKIISERFQHQAILIGVIILFFMILLPNSLLWIVVKSIYFIALISLIYILHQIENESVEEENDVQSDILLEKQDWLQIENEQDIEEIFEKFIGNILELIKKVIISDSVVLLFANYSKDIFTIRHKITDKEESFIKNSSFPISRGLPGLVLRNRSPLIENHLPHGSEIIPYYQQNTHTINSFAAVPVSFNNYIIGVLAIDSKEEEAYSNDDIELLKFFCKLINTQLVNSNKLYEYETENWVANVLFEVSQGMNGIRNTDELWDFLIKKIPEAIECERISISLKTDEKYGEIIRLEGGIGNLTTGKKFPLNEGIVGWVIRKNQSLLVEDFSLKDKYVPRFVTAETPAKDYFSLLSVPVVRGKEVIGAICLESKQTNNFKDQHKRILRTISNQAANVYVTSKTIEQMSKLNFKDAETNLMNINAFKMILPKELQNSKIHNYYLYLIVIKMCFHLREESEYLIIQTLKELLSLILPYLQKSDYIFRLDKDIFTILTSKPGFSDIKKFVDNIAHRIDDKKIWSGGEASEVYLNIGMLRATDLDMDFDKTLEKINLTVELAAAQEPNTLAVYNEVEET